MSDSHAPRAIECTHVVSLTNVCSAFPVRSIYVSIVSTSDLQSTYVLRKGRVRPPVYRHFCVLIRTVILLVP